MPSKKSTPNPPDLPAHEQHVIAALTADIGRVRCRQCDGAATELHLIPWVVDMTEIIPACRKHDPGGYFIEIEYLRDDWRDWKRHIHNKLGGDLTWWRLVRWLVERVA